jgi:hypothetical protein
MGLKKKFDPGVIDSIRCLDCDGLGTFASLAEVNKDLFAGEGKFENLLSAKTKGLSRFFSKGGHKGYEPSVAKDLKRDLRSGVLHLKPPEAGMASHLRKFD